MILKVSFLAQVLLSTGCALKDASVTLVRSKSSVSSTTAAVLVGNLTVTALSTSKPSGTLKYPASQIQSLFVALSYFQPKSTEFVVGFFLKNFSISCEAFWSCLKVLFLSRPRHVFHFEKIQHRVLHTITRYDFPDAGSCRLWQLWLPAACACVLSHIIVHLLITSS